MISNSGTASSTSFFTPLSHWLQLVHFQSWTFPAANHPFKQFSKLATPLYGTGISIPLRTSFLIYWYLQLLHYRTDETLPWCLGNCSTEIIAIRNSCASCCVLSANCGNSTLTACLACTGCITFPSALFTNFSSANTCSWKSLYSFLTRCLGLLLNDESPLARHWKIAFIALHNRWFLSLQVPEVLSQ